jgi:hypothetical protein
LSCRFNIIGGGEEDVLVVGLKTGKTWKNPQLEEPWCNDIREKKAPEKTLLTETKTTAHTKKTITIVW